MKKFFFIKVEVLQPEEMGCLTDVFTELWLMIVE